MWAQMVLEVQVGEEYYHRRLVVVVEVEGVEMILRLRTAVSILTNLLATSRDGDLVSGLVC